MAEIKSTLDLVMEKTRNMTFSSEEKKALQVEEARKSFNGLLQKHLDGLIEFDELQKGITGLEEEFGLDDRRVLQKVVTDKLELASLVEPLLVILETVFGCDTAALRNLAKDYRSEITGRSDDRRRELSSYFQERYEVWGSAVTPNLDADVKWKDESSTLHDLFAAKLEQEKSRLCPSSSHR